MKETKIIHELTQEEAKKNIQEINLILHPAGGFDKSSGFVYEPVGDYQYVWYYKGCKGLGIAKRYGYATCSACGFGIKKDNGKIGDTVKCSCEKNVKLDKETWTLNTGTPIKAIFNGIPIKNIIYNVPQKESINFWLNNYLLNENEQKISFDDVFHALISFFKVYFDFPIEKEVDLLALSIIESWLVELLDVVFYVTVNGETGSGKTALLEAMGLVARHGMVAASIKSAGIARVTERYKLSLFIDEIDKLRTKDDDIEGICRQGYRRGQKYIRMAPKSLEPEFFDIFGFKAFSFRSEVADDLQNRSIDIPLVKSKSVDVPIMNLFKQYFNPFELIFFWYLENAAELYVRSPNFSYRLKNEISELNELVNNVNTVNTVNIVNVNNNNNIALNGHFSRGALIGKVPFLTNGINHINKMGILGRNAEIAYLVFSLSKILNFDLNEVIKSSLNQKQEMEDANKDSGWIGMLKEILIEQYNYAENKDGIKYIPYAKVMKAYAYKMRDVYGNIPSEFQLKKLLRQLGFVDGINRKVVRINERTALCLVYDAEVIKCLGLN